MVPTPSTPSGSRPRSLRRLLVVPARLFSGSVFLQTVLSTFYDVTWYHRISLFSHVARYCVAQCGVQSFCCVASVRSIDWVLRSTGRGFEYRPRRCWVKPWASCLHTCESVTTQPPSHTANAYRREFKDLDCNNNKNRETYSHTIG